ncbi:hypothetical protein CO151_06110 [bacterium CG_4_9_14_3_um_filter_65_15]|nr:MAG: hypothetical protein CO151_06110 [bacterium CG_4_9_14_3_um_filter_65_15]
MRTFNRLHSGSAMSGAGSLILVPVLFGILLAATTPVLGIQAPLDTLKTPAPVDQAVAAAAAVGPMSRSNLPAITATQVPNHRATGRPPRLEDPQSAQLHYRIARRAALAGDPAGVDQNLARAMEASGSQPDIVLWQGLQAVKSFDTGVFLKAVPRFVLALVHSPVDQGRLLIGLQQAGVLATAIFWSLLLAALYFANWRYLAHDMTALMLRSRSHFPMRWLPFLPPLILLAFLPGWLAFLALASVPLAVRCRTRGRWLLVATWMVALVLVFPWWPPLRQAVPTIDPESEVATLHRACTSGPMASLRTSLTDRLAKAQNPAQQVRLLTALAIQEARSGAYDSSNRHLDAALAMQPDCLPAQVAKGNNVYYQGRLDTAMKLYKQAVQDHPNCGEAHYNLAQVYFRKLFVPEATAELETSRKLGFDPGPKAVTQVQKGYAAVVYPGLTRSSYLDACRDEAPTYAAQITLAAWIPLLGLPALPLYATVGLPLLLTIMIIMGKGPEKGPRECANCGVPLCGICRKVRDGASMCAVCGEIAQRAQSEMILATLLKNRSRSEGMATTQRIALLGRLLPGTGHLAGGRLGAAWLRLSLLAGGLFLMAASWAFGGGSTLATAAVRLPAELINPQWCPLPAALWPGWTALPFLVGMALVVVAGLIALTDGRRLYRVQPDRYSLIPVAAVEDVVPSYNASLR